MKSLYDSRPESPCVLCGLSWARGDAIGRWLGDWVHELCKAARAASVAAEGVTVELPEARGWADKKDFVDFSVVKNRKAFRSMVVR